MKAKNWLNLVYGPLTLSRPNSTTSTNAEMMLASRSYGTTQVTIPAGSAAVSKGTTNGAPANDFYGNSRSGHNDIGAVQFTSGAAASVAPNTLNFGNVRLNLAAGQAPTQVLTLTAPGAAALEQHQPVRVGIGILPARGNRGRHLPRFTGCRCVLHDHRVIAPTAAGAATGSVTITASSAVSGSPVALSGTGVKSDLAVSPTGLLQLGDAFMGTSSAAQTVTLTNITSSAVPVTGITVAFTGPFALSTTAAGPAHDRNLRFGRWCELHGCVVFTPNGSGSGERLDDRDRGHGFVVDGSPLPLTGSGSPLPVGHTGVARLRQCADGYRGESNLDADNLHQCQHQ